MPDHEENTPAAAPAAWGQPAWSEAVPQAAPTPGPFSAPAPWEQAAAFTAPPGASHGTAPIYDLRPLSTGEILDRTFSIYRKRFWLFAGLSVVAAGTLTISAFVQLTWGTVRHPPAASGEDPFAVFRAPEFTVLLITALITSVIYFFIYSLTQAATVHAVSEVYMGRETTIADSLRSVRARWFRYVAVAFWQGWSYLWLPLTLLLVGLPVIGFAIKADRGGTAAALFGGLLLLVVGLSGFYGIYAYMRNCLGIVAAVVENMTVKQSLVRSKQLTHHRLLRVLAIFLLLLVLGIAASTARAIPTFFLGLLLAASPVNSMNAMAILLEGIALVATFVTGVLLLPVGSIAFCLFYIDERVRREGFDVETLLGLGAPVPAGQQSGALASPFSGAGLV